jgi:hypothetical protein
MQIFRPLACNGIGLHYKFIKPNDANKLTSLILSVNKQNTTKIDPSIGVLGVLLTVGVTGLPVVHSSGSIQYSLEQRMNDCIGILQKINDVGQAKSILKTFLLDEEESRKTNEMVEAANTLVLLEPDSAVKGVLSPMGMISPIAEFGRKTAKRSTMKNGLSESSLVTFPVSLSAGSADAARTMTERLSVLSVAESDTCLRKYEHSGQERKANLDLNVGTKSRFRRRKADSSRDADFDNFDYKGPVKEVVERKAIPALPQPSTPEQPPPTGKLQLKSSRKDTRKAPRRLSNHMAKNLDDDTSSQQTKNSFDPFTKNKKKQSQHQFDDEISEATGSSKQENGSVVSNSQSTRVQVSIALNEDLTCSYKLSQLSSCNIEGVVQVSLCGL